MKNNDIKLIKKLCSLDEEELLFCLKDILCKYEYEKTIVATDQYIIAEGDIPICFVAHCDTVFFYGERKWFYDQKKQMLWSPNGAGFDDRTGIFLILKILQRGYRPAIIFTTEEEMGGTGAEALVKKYKRAPFKEPVKMLVELDRAGSDDCVFYGTANKSFKKMINGFGFKTKEGTFTDISIISPAWKIVAVNLSVGYYDEHTLAERLKLKQTYATLQKVINIIEQIDCIPYFSYIERKKEENYFVKPKKNYCYWCERKVKEETKYHIPFVGNVTLCDDCAQFLNS